MTEGGGGDAGEGSGDVRETSMTLNKKSRLRVPMEGRLLSGPLPRSGQQQAHIRSSV